MFRCAERSAQPSIIYLSIHWGGMSAEAELQMQQMLRGAAGAVDEFDEFDDYEDGEIDPYRVDESLQADI